MNEMLERTDVHRPSALITEDYEYLFAADTKGPWALGMSQTEKGREFLRELSNHDPSDPHPSTNQCSHCGSWLRYVAWLKHVPSGYTITVGETCLENRFALATAEFHRLRKAAELDRQQQRIKKAVAEFVETNSDLAFMADKDHEHTNDFVADVSRKLRQYGELTDRQIEAVRRSIQRDAEWAVKKAEREAAEALKPKVDVVEGRIEITGKVISTKWQDNDFGGCLKMLVEDERGFRVWGSVPSSLESRTEWDENNECRAIPGVGRGDQIKFTATVEQSQDDSAFGFFKRPAKAEILVQAEES